MEWCQVRAAAVQLIFQMVEDLEQEALRPLGASDNDALVPFSWLEVL